MRTVDAAGLAIGDDHPTRIMGVLNVSKESPYKPSVYDDASAAAEYVDEELIGEGADIVDVGLESANKDLDVLSAEAELERLDTAVETIESVSGDAVFSIETRYHEVAEAALDRGFDMVNDICGFADPEMPRVCEEYDVAVGKMASPPDLERPGAVEDPDDIYDALAMNGFTEKTVIDPAFGGWSAAKSLEDDRETFRRLREFRGYGRPMLVSINRKNFLRDLAGRDTEGALPVSLAATAMAVERGAHVVRTHDVAETRDAAVIGDAFTPARLRATEAGVEELDARTPAEVQRHLDRLGAPADLDHAARAATRVFELTGLTERDRATLAAPPVGAGFAPGAAEGSGVLYGTPRALRSLAEEIDGSDRLRAALERVEDTLDASE
jgi:dihydropteroate synthase